MSKKDKKKPEEVKEEIVREPEQETVEEISPEEKLQKEIEELKHEVNKPFDANYCNALLTEKVEGVEPNTVVEVLQKGYILKDRLLRAALVKVSE